MKLLLYGLNFAPELTGIGKYTGEMAAWLAARGHQVRVVTAPPYYPAWKVGDGFRNGWQTEVMDCRVAGAPRNDDAGSLVVCRCPLWVPPQPGGIKRLLHLASFALSSLPVMLRHIVWRPDVVWVVEPALFCAPAALGVARLAGAKAWLHVQDFEVDAAFDLGLLKGQQVRRWVAAAERWLMRRFDVASTISQRMHQRLLDKGVDAAKAVLAPNWVDISAITPGGHGLPRFARNDEVNHFRTLLGIAPSAVVALYSGNMGAKQGLALLADVAKRCLAQAAPAQPAIVFVFCGNGAGRADLVQRCAGLPNVHFLDLQPMERLNELLALADVHLLPQRADAADLVMPSKLTGMLASGRPVLATARLGTELASVVQGCGVVVPPEDPLAMAQAMLALAADAALREQLGAAGRAHALAHMDRDAVLRQFESALMAVTQ
ncbi:MAG: glycosyltransferase WbuB [Polaromonas sp.]|nr:glycosyltransferase WbuB [Polaromonas sp.]